MLRDKIKLFLALAIIPEIMGGCSQAPVSTGQNNINKTAAPSIMPKITETAKATPLPVKPAAPVQELNPLEIKTLINSGIVDSNTRFGVNLFQELLKKDLKKNIFISPASISIALMMTYNGADGETKKEMAETLQVAGMDISEVNKAYNLLSRKLQNPAPGVQLTIANSLWGKKSNGFSFIPEFFQNNKNFYDAEINMLDFSKPETVSLINDWVEAKTNGKISKAIDKITDEDILFLINAIYFKSSWAKEFKKEDTTERLFNLPDGTTKLHSMMSQFGFFKFFAGPKEKFQAISLPYDKDGRVSMYVFLPDKTSSLEEFYKDLTAEKLERWLYFFMGESGYLVLPKFKLEYDFDLKEKLPNIGMKQAFSMEKANFNKMVKSDSTENDVYISKATHKTHIEVNEEGTEAAAATTVRPVDPSSSPPPIVQMIVDRPFFFLIRDNETGEILFMGSIVDPQ